MKDRGAALPPRGYQCCVFCGHNFVDLPPGNIETSRSNDQMMTKYSKEYQHLQDVNDGKRYDLPLNKKGKEIKKITPPPMKNTVLRCHYHQ